jgi:hypothetical protein
MVLLSKFAAPQVWAETFRGSAWVPQTPYLRLGGFGSTEGPTNDLPNLRIHRHQKPPRPRLSVLRRRLRLLRKNRPRPRPNTNKARIRTSPVTGPPRRCATGPISKSIAPGNAPTPKQRPTNRWRRRRCSPGPRILVGPSTSLALQAPSSDATPPPRLPLDRRPPQMRCSNLLRYHANSSHN